MNNRKQKIINIVSVYINRYTAAQFCDWTVDIERYSEKANNWMLAQRADNNITTEEMREAIAALEPTADHTPFAYDTVVMQ